jgi:hypothetical protein
MVKILTFDSDLINIDLGTQSDRFSKTTILQLKERLGLARPDLKNSLDIFRLRFDNCVLENEKSLAFYNINDTSKIDLEKYYDVNKKNEIPFVRKSGDLDNDTAVVTRAVVRV